MMELYQVSSKHLDGWIAENLQPSREFRNNVQEVVDRICTFLKERCTMDARVIKTVKGGSAAKGTALDDNSDADLVIFLNCFSSYKDQAEKRASVISTIEKNLRYYCQSIAYKVEVLPPKSMGRPPRSLSLTIQSRKKKESVEVDILPAYDVLGQITSTFKPSPRVYRDLIQAKGDPGEFNTCFTELQRNFVKRCPAKLKNLLRLVKYWYKKCKEHLKERNPSSSLPYKFALELLTIYAWEEGTCRAEQFNTAEGFCTVMQLLVHFQDLCLYWTEYYSLEDSIIGPYVKEKLRGPRPVIMDPADPTGDVAKGKGWDLLAKEASICLKQFCCKKVSGEPIQPWDLKPARTILVEVENEQTGARQVILCSPYYTIWQIKEEMKKEGSVSACDQDLVLQEPDQNTIVLQDDKKLADYGVFYNTTTLQLLPKPQAMCVCL
ncbi:2'-5'-oligoadenylate synthase-like protein 2 [Rhineura floridana]|uniref:2'-5'-oligoadenylate synthase-like protein 2 n=1 Tax=Rhineura floridana TaxID=261503 RepID=UPI002AC83213|nr:2'-5'-oligoadenylate synthase-like protein 2 [Rhineura floridana]